MIRRPPRSTLFPYTTLSDLSSTASTACAGPESSTLGRPGHRRSEEHTSELQSRRDLVCRLLLEKKKRTKDEQHNHKAQNRRPTGTRCTSMGHTRHTPQHRLY